MIIASNLASQSSLPFNTYMLPVFLSSMSAFKKTMLLPTNMMDFFVSSSTELIASGFPGILPIVIHINRVCLFSPLFIHSGSCPLFGSHNSAFIFKILIFGAKPKYFVSLFKTDTESLFLALCRGKPEWIDALKQSVSRLQSFACVTLKFNSHLASWHLWTPSPQPLYLF